MNRDSHRPGDEQLRRRLWLLILRILAICNIVTMIALLIHGRDSLHELEGKFYIAATVVFLVGLFWKRVYANPFFLWQPCPFASLTAYVGALIRHSPFSSFYAAGFIAVEALAVIAWLQSRHGWATDGSARGSGPDGSHANTK